MKLLSTQTDESSLAAFGLEASAMLMEHDYSALANRFGYALAYGREPAAAIEADFQRVASSLSSASSAHPSVMVKYFAPNNTGLFAAVECTVPVINGTAVLLELIVSGKGEERNLTVEDISSVAA